MVQFIVVRTTYGLSALNISEIISVEDGRFSFKKSTIYTRSGHEIDCLETAQEVFDKINAKQIKIY